VGVGYIRGSHISHIAETDRVLPKLTGYCMVDPDKKKNVDIIKRENGEAMAFVETLIGRIIIYLPMGRFGATKVTRVVVHVSAYMAND
jgi:hypothetical protein